LNNQRAASQFDQGEGRQSMTRITILATLMLFLPGWTLPGENILRVADSTEIPAKAAGKVTELGPDMEMYIGRGELEKGNRIGALNRFKTVVTRFQTSDRVEEALARLVEIYLALDIPSEAQTSAAVLGRKFPDGRWSAEARNALKAAGFEPAEDEKSRTRRTFK
jgi:outer membrane protein assembly factor BamD